MDTRASCLPLILSQLLCSSTLYSTLMLCISPLVESRTYATHAIGYGQWITCIHYHPVSLLFQKRQGNGGRVGTWHRQATFGTLHRQAMSGTSHTMYPRDLGENYRTAKSDHATQSETFRLITAVTSTTVDHLPEAGNSRPGLPFLGSRHQWHPHDFHL